MKAVSLVFLLFTLNGFAQIPLETVVGNFRYELPNVPDSTGLVLAVHPIESISIDSSLRVSTSRFSPNNDLHCKVFKGSCEVRNDTLIVTYTSALNTCNLGTGLTRESVSPEIVETYLFAPDASYLVSLDGEERKYHRIIPVKKEP